MVEWEFVKFGVVSSILTKGVYAKLNGEQHAVNMKEAGSIPVA